MSVDHVRRASLAWPILVGVAKKRDGYITYGELAEAIGVHHRAIRFVLGVIQDYCLSEKLPPLTILVANKAYGMPGDGFIAWDVDDIASGVELVSAHPWDLQGNPFQYASDGETEETLANSIVSMPSSAAEVYARVKVRGVAQSIFRKVLLKTYGGKCVFCGMTFEEALEAAHLIPWAKASHEQRMAPSNGVLACSTHHQMMDSGAIALGLRFDVVYYDAAGADGPYSDADSQLSLALHGKDGFVPSQKQFHPSREGLEYRLSNLRSFGNG